MKLYHIGIFYYAAFVMFASNLMAQTNGPQYADNSPRAFVDGFYKWYVPRALTQDTAAGRSETLRLMRSYISPQLAKLLEEDAAAQAKCNELVSLDFDPFLYTQEPAEHYETANISKAKTVYRAGVYRLNAGRLTSEADVIAQFTQMEGHWIFTDFIYPGGSDLLANLKSRSPCTSPK